MGVFYVINELILFPTLLQIISPQKLNEAASVLKNFVFKSP